MAKNKNSENQERKKFDIEKIPKETRITILIVSIIFIMIFIVTGWIYSLKSTITDRAENPNNSEWEEIKQNFYSFTNEAKENINQVKESLQQIVQPSDNQVTDISQDDLDKIKQKLLLKETQDWQIYTNDKYQFQIKYPGILTIEPGQDSEIIKIKDNQDQIAITVKKYDSADDAEKENDEITKYLENNNYDLGIINLAKNTTTNLIIQTFKFIN